MKLVFELRAVRINVLGHKFRQQKERNKLPHMNIFAYIFRGGGNADP